MTVYVFEALLGELIHEGLGRVLGTRFSDSLLLVLAMGMLCVAVWAGLTRLWARVGCVGSVEWCYARLCLGITGERTSKMDLGERRPGRGALPDDLPGGTTDGEESHPRLAATVK